MAAQQNKLDLLNLEQVLSQRQQNDMWRERSEIHSACSTEVKLVKQGLNHFEGVNFASNDYLGLANSDEAKSAVGRLVNQLGFGSGASHLICGHHLAHEQLEKALAEFLQRESALTFSSGYVANLSILQTLAKKGDLIVADKLNHASLIDGVRLSDAQSSRYPHGDLSVLESRLKKAAANKFVVTDSVFSMDGDIAPLKAIAEVCQKYDAILIVDDAHGFGVLGKHGRGCCEHFDLNQNQIPILMTTLGKSLGGVGACVSGKKLLVDYLIQFARPYIYTTAIPAINAIGNLANLSLLEGTPELIHKLHKNIELFKAACDKKNIPLLASSTAIQPIHIGDHKRLMSVNKALMNKGFLVGAIRPPTVPVNGARLRVTLSAAHTEKQIAGLVIALAQVL
ncbi:8-amino-7-oxononanoate synthase [Aliikangiella marina]|uniref:8-amino-7-ketopelargonate synthase n=1 Tax=Aliikangiella marina TaxID=1712262 RepID=A0A545TD83_9GAMM|nr:8-amino-7-oxononanoate synthase [Aliikangiella marina]TQV75151.1 8-amino-7-oxononanoate synthase [Aliikangiella marina]